MKLLLATVAAIAIMVAASVVVRFGLAVLLTVVAMLLSAVGVGAQTHAHLTGEKVGVDTKTCYYNANGNVLTRVIVRSRPCPLTILLPAPLPRPRRHPVPRETIHDSLRDHLKVGLVEQQKVGTAQQVDDVIDKWNRDEDPEVPFEHGCYAVIEDTFKQMYGDGDAGDG